MNQNPTQSKPEDAEQPSAEGLSSSVLLAVLEPVLEWYQSDEHEPREPLDILRDIVIDLQTDRAENLKSAAKLANYRRFVGKLATAKNKNEAWGIAKCWAPDELWRSIGFDLATDEERQAFIFG